MVSPAARSHSADDPAPLVGRSREQTLLHDRLAAALAGRGSLVLVGGEAGIGKTALARALVREARTHRADVLAGHCYDLSETPPYGPWAELFAPLAPVHDLPFLAVLAPQAGAPVRLTSQAAIFSQARQALVMLAAQQPLVLVLEDLHWADPASLDLLRFLARHLAELPVLVLATYRGEAVTRQHPLYQLIPLLVREAQAARLDLRPLGAEEVRALVQQRYRLAAPDEARLLAYLNERAEGNPFFVGELLRALEEDGRLRLQDGGWTVGDLERAGLPLLLRQVIDGRVARLGEDTHRLLTIAAVVGQEVPLALWAAVSGADEEALLEIVERAVEAGLLTAGPTGTAVRFVHALMREALYESLLPPRRRAWHRRVAEMLLAEPAPDPDAVAYHFRQAGDARAVEWLVQAGERAGRASAYLTAAERFEAALALLEERPDTAGGRGRLRFYRAWCRRYTDPPGSVRDLEEAIRLALAARDRALLFNARFLLAHVCCWADLGRGLEEMTTVVAELDALTPDEWAALQLPVALLRFDKVQVWGTLIEWLSQAGRFAEGQALGARITAHLSVGSIGGPGSSGLRNAERGLGIMYALLGRPEEARRALTRHREAVAAEGNLMLVGDLTGELLAMVALPYEADRLAERQRLAEEMDDASSRGVGVLLQNDRSYRAPFVPLRFLEGDWTAARRYALAAHEWFHAARDYHLYISPLGHIARAQGDAAAAWALVRAVLPDGPATAPGSTSYRAALAVQRLAAALALDAADLPTARAWLAAHERWLDWNGSVLGQAEGQVGWAAYYRAGNDLPRAAQHATQALDLATSPRQPLALLAAHRLLGELALAVGRLPEASTQLAAALALADACAAPYERALTLLALAELDGVSGQPAAAQARLDEVCTICAPLEARVALAQADALAARLAAPPSYPAGLTAREAEVLRLVAAGLTNAQVAERLFVTPRTVNAHLTTIYTKLGVAGRGAAIRFALDHDLG